MGALVLGKVDSWTGSREGPNWSFVMSAYDWTVKQMSGHVTSAENSTDVVINVQLEGVQLCFVLGHVVHGKRLGSHHKCSSRMEFEGVATSLSGVFPEERCKVDDDGGTGRFVGHERYDGRGCLGEFTRRCL